MHTLRYYERAGLVVTPVGRTAGGRRRYHQLDLEWIVVCTKLRATGMPIKTIRRYPARIRWTRQRAGTPCSPGGPPHRRDRQTR
ncbi:MerR family transcriptional regulator [Actinoallomurus iriomotensis]|uniref:MerR family transcriptional regulator n=1 Tax=Actinoallomurus iriomotensis TaxID=478107 RepID=UPI0032DB9800